MNPPKWVRSASILNHETQVTFTIFTRRELNVLITFHLSCASSFYIYYAFLSEIYAAHSTRQNDATMQY